MTTNANEELIGTETRYPKTKPGDRITLRFSSSSPPAVWTDAYTVTRIDSDGNIYGIYSDRPEFHEFSGKDME